MLAKAEAAEDDETTPLARAKVVARTLLKDIALPSRCALITAGDRTELAAAMSPDPQPAINLVDDLKLFISSKNLGKNGSGNIKNHLKLFLKNKKNIIEKINLFGDTLKFYRMK